MFMGRYKKKVNVYHSGGGGFLSITDLKGCFAFTVMCAGAGIHVGAVADCIDLVVVSQ